MDRASIREATISAAAELFYKTGYERTTMREVARKANVPEAAVFALFSSKSDMLRQMYAYYNTQRRRIAPSVEDLVEMANTHSLEEIAQRLDYRFPPGLRERCNQIIAIAWRRCFSDAESELFLLENHLDNTKKLLGPLLHRLIEMGKIEPFDVEGFITVNAYYGLGAAASDRSSLQVSSDLWSRGMKMVFSLIKPVAARQ